MSELIDNKPVFTIVMGCNGAGKSAWKRANYDALPERYIDQDSIAGGFGDWNNPRNRERVREKVDVEIDEYIEAKLDFGMESTFSGLPGPTLVDRVVARGYRVCGVYFGTDSPNINISRIDYRVAVYQGHDVDPTRIPQRHAHSLSNLRKYFDTFDELELIDNSQEDEISHQPMPVTQAYVVRGKITPVVTSDEMAPWCLTLIERVERARATRERQKIKIEKKDHGG